jgi:hypothetical protein
MRKTIGVLFLISMALKGSAQTTGLGTWNIFNTKFTYTEKWSFFAEGQLRSLGFYNQFNYHELKGGVHYSIRPSVLFTLGAGSYQTYQPSGNFTIPKTNSEFRLWPQLIVLTNLGRINIEQRFRTEFRWQSIGFRNRYRYRMVASYPFGAATKGFKPWQVSVGDEIFFGKQNPFFEQNRLQLSLNYRLSQEMLVQLGYLNQVLVATPKATRNHYLVLGYYLEIFGKRMKHEGSNIAGKDF